MSESCHDALAECYSYPQTGPGLDVKSAMNTVADYFTEPVQMHQALKLLSDNSGKSLSENFTQLAESYFLFLLTC